MAFSFAKLLSGPILSINKPRVTETNATQTKTAFEICISSTPSTSSFEVIENEYGGSAKEQMP